MANVIITEKNFKRAHSEGSAEIKKTLENLAPEVFKTKFPAWAKGLTSGAIYYFTSENTHIRLTNGNKGDAGLWSEKNKLGEPCSAVYYSDQIPIKGIREIE